MTIKILGAGIAGLTAAIVLAKSGHLVEVFEKNKDCGMRFHGDLQGLENWSEKKDVVEELKKIGIEINFQCDAFNKFSITNCVDLKEVANYRPIYYLVKRGCFEGSLDLGLKEQAIKSGVKINFERTLQKSEVDIIATGPIFSEAPAVDKGIMFKTKSKDMAVIVFNDALAYRGYSYLLISKGHGCMCTFVFKDMTKINEYFKRTEDYFIKNFGIEMESIKEVGGTGSIRLKPTFKDGKSLYVGEATGLQDFLWGFGIRSAIKSGYLAAQSIIEGKDYEKMAKKQFNKKIKASFVNRFVWEKMGKNNYRFIVKNANFVKNNLYSISNFNIIHRALYPFAKNYVKKEYPKMKI
ncbi:MAG: NAD(P)/FAD-dependent oxidoreductase [Nanoarchaeota archaeon]